VIRSFVIFILLAALIAVPIDMSAGKKPDAKKNTQSKTTPIKAGKKGSPVKAAGATTGKGKQTSASSGKNQKSSKNQTVSTSRKGGTANGKKSSGISERAVKGQSVKGRSLKPEKSVSGSKSTEKSRRDQTATRNVSSKSKSGSKDGATTRTSEPQTKSIRLKQEELDKLRKDIQEYERRIAQSRKEERSARDRIDDFGKQTTLIKQLVSHLNAQVDFNQREIDAAQKNLAVARKSLDQMKEQYGRSIVHAYKQGQAHDTELLLSASSLNQMFIRAKYLRAFTAKHRVDINELNARRKAVEEQKSALEDKVVHQQKAIGEKHQEEGVLKHKIAEHQDLLEKARQDKFAYQQELKRKQAAAAKIERLIADLIERERMKRLAAMKKKSPSLADNNRGSSSRRFDDKISALPDRPISQTAFGRLRGRLPWPVSQGSLSGGFGDQVNPRLGTVTSSLGIDIKTPVGSTVKSVADGRVSVISFIPGYGNIIIISHEDGFYTVYAHVTEVSVSENQRVKAGQGIAHSGEGLSGPLIHFEVRRQRQIHNPLTWLAKR
jgi:murein hydrolase activator